MDIELAESFGQLVGADRAAGLPAGEQPWGGSLVADGGVAAAGGDEVKDEAGQRFGEHDGFTAQPQPYLVVAGLNVVDGEAADRGRPWA